MSFVELLLVAVGLSMDAFAVSVCKGLGMRRLRWGVALELAFFFGGFQALMPVIGWLVGSRLLWLIAPVDHWIAFGLLGFVGGKMIRDAVVGDTVDEADESDSVGLGEVVVLAVATSIDALAVGISFAALGMSIEGPAAVIGVVTFVFSVAGVVVGNAFGARYERGAEAVGGVVLVMLGIKILLEHLGVI